MKKIFSAFLLIVIFMALSACAGQATPDTSAQATAAAQVAALESQLAEAQAAADAAAEAASQANADELAAAQAAADAAQAELEAALWEGLVVVVPAESLDLGQDVDFWEISGQLLDKVLVKLAIKGIVREAIAEVVEDRLFGIQGLLHRPAWAGVVEEVLGVVGCGRGWHELVLLVEVVQIMRFLRAATTRAASMVPTFWAAALCSALRAR